MIQTIKNEKLKSIFFSGETAANLEPLQNNHIGKVHKGT